MSYIFNRILETESYSEPSRTSKMEVLSKIVKRLKAVNGLVNIYCIYRYRNFTSGEFTKQETFSALSELFVQNKVKEVLYRPTSFIDKEKINRGRNFTQ